MHILNFIGMLVLLLGIRFFIEDNQDVIIAGLLIGINLLFFDFILNYGMKEKD